MLSLVFAILYREFFRYCRPCYCHCRYCRLWQPPVVAASPSPLLPTKVFPKSALHHQSRSNVSCQTQDPTPHLCYSLSLFPYLLHLDSKAFICLFPTCPQPFLPPPPAYRHEQVRITLSSNHQIPNLSYPKTNAYK